MDIIERAQVKGTLLKCAQLCGGVTGKFAKRLCSDDTIIREMMEDGELRRIPVEVKMSDRTTKKMYFYEDSTKQKQANFPNMKEEDAKRISILNNCFCTYYEESQWLKKSDVKRLVSMSDISDTKLMPDLMFYNNNQLIAVYVRKNYAKLTDGEKTKIESNLTVDRVIEYLY